VIQGLYPIENANTRLQDTIPVGELGAMGGLSALAFFGRPQPPVDQLPASRSQISRHAKWTCAILQPKEAASASVKGSCGKSAIGSAECRQERKCHKNHKNAQKKDPSMPSADSSLANCLQRC
jgi:hypothetical protein